MRFPVTLNNNQIQTIIDVYSNCSLPLTNNYTLFRAKINSTTLTIFKTKTVMLQGTTEIALANEIFKLLNIDQEIKSDNNPQEIKILKNLIGTDEVGTGDFFGSIFVVAAYVTIDNIDLLNKLGVKDSKELTDTYILQVAPELMKLIDYEIIQLDNMHYNYLVTKKGYNMNSIKANMHNSAINAIKRKVSDYDDIIIDAFTTQNNYYNYLKDVENVSKDVKLIEKAENKYTAVACASIIARYLFLKDIEKLSREVGFDLPKGAGKPVDAVIRMIYKNNIQKILPKIAKINFNNLQKLFK